MVTSSITRTSTFPVARGSEPRVVDGITQMLGRLGVQETFGLIGGAVAPLADAIARSPIRFIHTRHEAGAAFAAVETSLLGDRPVAIFTTTGPGLLNALNGMVAGRWDGARLLLLSAVSGPEHRGRLPVQESSPWTLPHDGLYAPGPIFDAAAVVHDARELVDIERRLVIGFSRPQGFVAHLGLPTSLQSAPLAPTTGVTMVGVSRPSVSAAHLDAIAAILEDGPFAIWVGYGARHAAASVRQLAERCGAPVLATPRAKGIFPEDHPLFAGVTGAGGHEAAVRFVQEERPRRILVLGTRLGEASSFWDERLVPTDGFLHVDVDARAFGGAYPHASTVGVEAEVGAFLDELLPYLPKRPQPWTKRRSPFPKPVAADKRSPVRIGALFSAIQKVVVDGSDAVVLAESGNAFGFANHLLRFQEPGRYRSSAAWGSMGHMTCGVLGAAVVHKKAVAIVGDGAMMMNNEVNAAVQERLGTVWIVLNDGGFGIVRDGMRGLGLKAAGCDIPRGDFTAFARSMGADGVLVEREDQLEAALVTAMAATTPFVVDVRVASELSPALAGRVASLKAQGRDQGASTAGTHDRKREPT